MRYYSFYAKKIYIQTYSLHVGQSKSWDNYKNILAASIERTSVNCYRVIVIYKERVVFEKHSSMTLAFSRIKECYISQDI